MLAGEISLFNPKSSLISRLPKGGYVSSFGRYLVKIKKYLITKMPR